MSTNNANHVANHVIDGLYIGGARLIYRVDELRAAGVTSILKLYESEPSWPSDFTVCNNELPDGVFIPRETLDRGVKFIDAMMSEGKPVLVLCGAGISRSSTFVLAYLLKRGYKLPDAWRLLKDRHREADPLPEMWKSLIEHFDLNYSVEDVLDWR